MKTRILAMVASLCVFSLVVALSNGVPIAKAATDEQIEQAITNGLAWLAQQQNPDGNWGGDVARTALAVLKFEDYARELELDPFDHDYEYSNNVIDGLDYIFSHASIMDISDQPAGDPDTNGNGTGVYWSDGWSTTYYTSIVMMAIAGSKTPDRSVSVGACSGWTYKDVLQDAADYMAYGQSDIQCVDRGGWYYSALNNSCGNDNSNTGYAVLGLGYAQVDPFNCTIPPWVMDELSLYCDYIQNDVDGEPNDGGSGYNHPDSWVNVLKTGNLLYEMKLTGDTEETERVKDALGYLERHWGDNADPGWRPNHYQAMYTIMKGLEVFWPYFITFGDPEIDWYADFSDAIVSQQNDDGSWSGCPCYCSEGWCNDCGSIICTEWALLTLERAVPNRSPDCSEAYASIQEIWPPNHKYVDIEIMGVIDPDGDPVTITITGITQDEPVDAIGNGDGKTSPDGAGVGTSNASVRAERQGKGNGRVYEISFTATDPAGAECSGSVTVCVPHDQRPGHECIDDGQDYGSTVE